MDASLPMGLLSWSRTVRWTKGEHRISRCAGTPFASQFITYLIRRPLYVTLLWGALVVGSLPFSVTLAFATFWVLVELLLAAVSVVLLFFAGWTPWLPPADTAAWVRFLLVFMSGSWMLRDGLEVDKENFVFKASLNARFRALICSATARSEDVLEV